MYAVSAALYIHHMCVCVLQWYGLLVHHMLLLCPFVCSKCKHINNCNKESLSSFRQLSL